MLFLEKEHKLAMTRVKLVNSVNPIGNAKSIMQGGYSITNTIMHTRDNSKLYQLAHLATNKLS